MGRRARGRPPHDDVLTPAEWRIAHPVQHGMSDREIAERRGISRDGVKFHVDNVREKLDLRTRKALRQWFRPPKDSALARRRRNTVNELELGPIGQAQGPVVGAARVYRFIGPVGSMNPRRTEAAPSESDFVAFRPQERICSPQNGRSKWHRN
jgi:DNA-binding CsgD family transcriptional regulator